MTVTSIILRSSRAAGQANGLTNAEIDGNMTALKTTADAAATFIGGTTAAVRPIANPGGTNAGVMIPYYLYPNNPYSDATFARLLGLIAKYRDVPTMVILNAGTSPSGRNGGPGTVWDGNYAAAIRLLKAAGAFVAGYVSTNYAAQTFNQVKSDVDGWDLYSATPIDGIFLDEFPYAVGTANANVVLYQQHYAYIRDTKNYAFCVGNPGADEQGAWYATRTADIIVMWETSTYPSDATLKGNFTGGHVDYSWTFNAIMVHSMAVLDRAFLQRAATYAKWFYITDDVFSGGATNPYDALSGHLEDIYAILTAVRLSGARVVGRLSTAVLALTDAAPTTLDATTGNDYTWTMGASRTLAMTGATAGQTISIEIKQDATGGRVVTWPASFTWMNNSPGVLATAPGAVNVLTAKTFDGTTFRAILTSAFG
jgi:hypothetical protein